MSSAEAGMRYQYDEMERRVRMSGMRNTDQFSTPMFRISAVRSPAISVTSCASMCSTCRNSTPLWPNGMMMVNSGLLLRIETEAELAFVVAHEFGHYFENHMLEQMAAQQGATRGSILSAGLAFTGVGALLALGYMAGAAASVMSFSREQRA